MKVDVTIRRMDKLFTLYYTGVKSILQLGEKVIVNLYSDYE